MPEEKIEIGLSSESRGLIRDWIQRLPRPMYLTVTERDYCPNLERQKKGHVKRMLGPANRNRVVMERMWYEFTPVVLIDEKGKGSVVIKEQQFRRRWVAYVTTHDSDGYPIGRPKIVNTSSLELNEANLKKAINQTQENGSLTELFPLGSSFFKGVTKTERETGCRWHFIWSEIPPDPGTVMERSSSLGATARCVVSYRLIGRWMQKMFGLSAATKEMAKFNSIMAQIVAMEDPANCSLEWVPSGEGRIMQAYKDAGTYSTSCMTDRYTFCKLYDEQENLFFVRLQKTTSKGVMPVSRCLVWKIATPKGEEWVADRAYPECVSKRSQLYGVLKAQAQKEGKTIHMPYANGGREHVAATPCAVLTFDHKKHDRLPYFDTYGIGCLIEDGNQMVIGTTEHQVEEFIRVHKLWAATGLFSIRTLDPPRYKSMQFTPKDGKAVRVRMKKKDKDIQDLSLDVVEDFQDVMDFGMIEAAARAMGARVTASDIRSMI